MMKRSIKNISIFLVGLFFLLNMQTFAITSDISSEAFDVESIVVNDNLNPMILRGYDDDVIYGYTITKRQSIPNFESEIRGYEIVRNGLRYRGTLYLKYTGGTAGDYYGTYEGDLYYYGRA